MAIEITAVCNASSLEELEKQLNKKIKEGFIAAGTPILADGEYFQSILRISVCKQHKFDNDAYEFQKKMYEVSMGRETTNE